MKVTLEPTGQIGIVNGTHARLWVGEDDAGVPVKAWIAMISPQTHDPAAHKRFATALRGEFFDIRLLVD